MQSTYSGSVVRGKQEARTLGYPTANIEYASDHAPEHGVWTCFVNHDGTTYQGLAVIGMWQQANGLPSLEVHLLDIERDFYDQTLFVTLQQKLRNLVAVSKAQELIELIENDMTHARRIFSHHERANT